VLNLHPSFEQVWVVIQPIPVIGAMPGDELILRPTDPDFPLEMRRTLPLDVLRSIPNSALREVQFTLFSSEASSADAAPPAPDQPAPASVPVALRLVG
jgi:hypothetical protein